jgi:hypothetical protein
VTINDFLVTNPMKGRASSLLAVTGTTWTILKQWEKQTFVGENSYDVLIDALFHSNSYSWHVACANTKSRPGHTAECKGGQRLESAISFCSILSLAEKVPSSY